MFATHGFQTGPKPEYIYIIAEKTTKLIGILEDTTDLMFPKKFVYFTVLLCTLL
jgi:hypothetical protein